MTICVALGVALAGEPVVGGLLVPTTMVPGSPDKVTGKPGPGMFLVARRALEDSHFGQSVVYLVEHDEGGTLGLIVNRSSDVSLSEAVPDIEDKHMHCTTEDRLDCQRYLCWYEASLRRRGWHMLSMMSI